MFRQTVTARLPEKRPRRAVELAVRGISDGQSPVVAHIARNLARDEWSSWPIAKRLYGLIWIDRTNHRDLLKGLYDIARHAVAQYAPAIWLWPWIQSTS
jgi:hypothetical protein